MEWVVYLVRCGKKESNPTKIGFSSNFNKRFDAIQTHNAYKLFVYGIIHCESKSHAMELEKFLHNSLKHCHIRGEWFRLHNAQLPKLLDHFNKVRDDGITCEVENGKSVCRDETRLMQENRRLLKEINRLKDEVSSLEEELIENQHLDVYGIWCFD